MRIKITSRVILSVLAINIVFILLLIPLFYVFNDKFTNSIIRSNNEASLYLRDNIRDNYHEMAMDSMKTLSSNTAYSIGQFLNSHPKMTRDDLIKSKEFQEMSVRYFYYTGYTIVADPNDYIIVSHSDNKFVGQRLFDISNFKKKTLDSLVRAFDLSKVQPSVPVVYEYADRRDSYQEKYAYISPVPAKTADGKQLIVIATVFTSDYMVRVDSILSFLFQKTNESATSIKSKSDLLILMIVLSVFVICIISLLISVYFMRDYTRKIVSLLNSCKRIAEGDYKTAVENAKTGDELEDLSYSIEYMRQNLKKQDEIIKGQIEKNKEKNKELEEALKIAEEKSRQYMIKSIISKPNKN